MHGKRKSQILESVHGTKYRTRDRNTSHVNTGIITSNQRFATKPKVLKPLKYSNEQLESTEKSSDTYTGKPRLSKQPKVSSMQQTNININININTNINTNRNKIQLYMTLQIN